MTFRESFGKGLGEGLALGLVSILIYGLFLGGCGIKEGLDWWRERRSKKKESRWADATPERGE